MRRSLDFDSLVRGVTRHLALIGFAVCSAQLAAAEPQEFDLNAVAGEYEEPAQRCVMLNDKVRDQCESSAKDRMVIVAIDRETARLIVHSHQENLHKCHVDGVAQIVNNGLRHCLESEPGTCLTVTGDAQNLNLHVTVEGRPYVPFCGSRATLDGLVFPLSSRLKNARCPHSRVAR